MGRGLRGGRGLRRLCEPQGTAEADAGGFPVATPAVSPLASDDGKWLAGHARIDGHETVIEANDDEHTLPRADLVTDAD